MRRRKGQEGKVGHPLSLSRDRVIPVDSDEDEDPEGDERHGFRLILGTDRVPD